jgi:hypothetical protein
MTGHVNQEFFSIWNPEMAYVLGFWFADGWMTQPGNDAFICYVSKDREHLELIRNAMQSEHVIHSQGEGYFRLPIGSKRLWNDLAKLGGMPAKSLVAQMPSVPRECLRHFIRGFVDGDGSLYWDTTKRRTPRINIVGGLLFLEKLAQVIHQETEVGIAKIRTHKSKTPFLAYSGIKAQVLAKWLYIPGELMLERKGTLAQEFGTWELSKFGWKSQAVMTTRMREILEW